MPVFAASAVRASLCLALLAPLACRAAGETSATHHHHRHREARAQQQEPESHEDDKHEEKKQEPKKEEHKDAWKSNTSVPAALKSNTSMPAALESIPPVPASCVTRRDVLAQNSSAAWVAAVAKNGTQCAFGADARDEGKHCIPELKYGTNGWCYTKLDQSEWGSCGRGCPLYGAFKSLGKDLDAIESKIDGINANLTKVARNMPKPATPPKEKKEEKMDAVEKDAEKDALAHNSTAAAGAVGGTPAANVSKAAKASGARRKQQQHHKDQRGKATSLAQTDSRSQRTATRLQVDAAVAFAQKASRQTTLWTNLAEKVLKLDGDDSLSVADEALKKAISWQNIANRAGARVNVVTKGATAAGH